ncbi:MAG: hypothetical protein IBX64_05160 [Actinobacteria bacterium]|nr:hypothetical protein [Actinomycetota bacterium]
MSTGIDVLVYPDGPEDSIPGFEQVDAKPGDALLIVNFFGLQTMRSIGWTDRSIVEIIEDHTHDPWSDWAWTSNADWCVASLRKVLPVPDGGVLWSPSDQPLPHTVPVSAERRYASLEKLTAMVLKSLYLEGQLVEKEVFRRLAISGESCIASGEISGMPEWTENLVHSFPVKLWRERRCSNHQVLYEALAGVPWLTLLLPEDNSGACPFSGILVFDSQECRTYVHERLIASRIYPAILWPLDEPVIDGIHQKYVDLSNRMLSIHCDMRYSEHEMEYIAAQIRKFGEEYYR